MLPVQAIFEVRESFGNVALDVLSCISIKKFIICFIYQLTRS